jgi:hypothetical protein
MRVFLLEVPLLAVWGGLALLEIIAPGVVIRWRRRWLNARWNNVWSWKSATVSDWFDGLTGEKDAEKPWTSPSVRNRVRLIGVFNLMLATCTAFVIVALAR